MKLFLVAVLITFVHSAPSPRQYIIYENLPLSLLPQRTIYTLPERIVESTSPFIKYGKQNLYYYLPTLGGRYQILMLRDEGMQQGDWWAPIQQWFQDTFQQTGGSEAGAAPTEQSDQMKKIMDKFEMLDKEGNKMPAEMKRDELKKIYILTQQPSSYNEIRLYNPFEPYPYYSYSYPLLGRSLQPDQQPEQQQQQQVVEQQPLLVPAAAQVVPEVVPLVKAVEPVVDPVLVVDPVVAAAAVPESPVQEKLVIEDLPQLQARDIEAEPEQKADKEKLEEKKPIELKEEIKLEEKKLELKEADNPSVAQAAPAAIALSGKGGISAASPVAASVVGDGGIALAAPQATSIAGEFPEEEEEKKQ